MSSIFRSLCARHKQSHPWNLSACTSPKITTQWNGTQFRKIYWRRPTTTLLTTSCRSSVSQRRVIMRVDASASPITTMSCPSSHTHTSSKDIIWIQTRMGNTLIIIITSTTSLWRIRPCQALPTLFWCTLKATATASPWCESWIIATARPMGISRTTSHQWAFMVKYTPVRQRSNRLPETTMTTVKLTRNTFVTQSVTDWLTKGISKKDYYYWCQQNERANDWRVIQLIFDLMTKSTTASRLPATAFLRSYKA